MNPNFEKFFWPIPSRHLPVQSQHWKHQNNMWNPFKVNNKDTICRSTVLIVNFEQISRNVLVFSLLTLNRSISAGNMPLFHFQPLTMIPKLAGQFLLRFQPFTHPVMGLRLVNPDIPIQLLNRRTRDPYYILQRKDSFILFFIIPVSMKSESI